jgi:O-antigen/teichoic acid export membrane protein
VRAAGDTAVPETGQQRTRAGRDYLLVGGGMGVARLASLATLVLLTRVLASPEFAAYSLGWAMWLLVSQLVSGIDVAYVDLQAAESSSDLRGSYWRVKIEASVALACAALVGIPAVGAIASWSPSEMVAAMVGGVSGSLTALYQTQLSIFQARQTFGRYAAGWIALNGLSLVITATLIVLGVHWAAPYVAAYGVAPLLLLGVSSVRLTVAADRGAATRSILRHAKWLIPSGALASFSNRADVLVASALLLSHDFAIYGAAARFFGLFQFALTSMGAVLLPRASQLRTGGGLRAYLRTALGLVISTGAAGCILIWQSHAFAGLLLGASYTGAATLMPALTTAAVLLAASVPLGWLLFTVRRPGAFALMTALVLVSKTAFAAVLIPMWGIRGAAWSLAGGYLFGLVFMISVIVRERRQLSAPSPGKPSRAPVPAAETVVAR